MITAVRAFIFLLRLYPRRQREDFGPEMAAVFEQAMHASRNRGRLPFLRFLLIEMAGLIAGAAREWSAGHPEHLESAARWLPADVVEARQRVDDALQRMVHAISHHRFEEARRFANEERRERENLRRLHDKYEIG